MNKNTYITPAMEIMNIETVEMMATSSYVDDSNKTIDSGSELAGGRRGSWGDLWGGEE